MGKVEAGLRVVRERVGCSGGRAGGKGGHSLHTLMGKMAERMGRAPYL